MSYSFVVKNDFGLTEPLTLRVMQPTWFWRSLYDRHPLNIRENLKKIARKTKVDGLTAREAVEAWLAETKDSIAPSRFEWGDDDVALIVGESDNGSTHRIKDANRKNIPITFVYRKGGDRLISVSGTPRRIDSARGLVVLETEGISHSRNFLMDEIVSVYEDHLSELYTWFFNFEPQGKQRVRVTVSLQDGFKRQAPRRRSAPKKEVEVPPSAKSLANVLMPQGTSESNYLGELFEVITPTGERLGLRVEYVKKVGES